MRKSLKHELTLTSLEDYVKGSSWDFDRDKFEEWEARLKVVTDPVNTNEYWFHRVQTEDWDSSLKARLRLGKETLKTLMDYVADIESDWSYGSVILRNLKFCSNSTIVALLPIAFLPVICPWGECSPIGWFEWGVFGIIGALLSVLRQLQRSDVIELGNTEGRREFMRAFVGGGLGLIAGLVAFAIVNAELVSSPLLPYQGDNKAATLYLPVIWAIASGFMFEKVFERVKAITRMRDNDDN